MTLFWFTYLYVLFLKKNLLFTMYNKSGSFLKKQKIFRMRNEHDEHIAQSF